MESPCNQKAWLVAILAVYRYNACPVWNYICLLDDPALVLTLVRGCLLSHHYAGFLLAWWFKWHTQSRTLRWLRSARRMWKGMFTFTKECSFFRLRSFSPLFSEFGNSYAVISFESHFCFGLGFTKTNRQLEFIGRYSLFVRKIWGKDFKNSYNLEFLSTKFLWRKLY